MFGVDRDGHGRDVVQQGRQCHVRGFRGPRGMWALYTTRRAVRAVFEGVDLRQSCRTHYLHFKYVLALCRLVVLLFGKTVPIPTFAGTGFFRKHSNFFPLPNGARRQRAVCPKVWRTAHCPQSDDDADKCRNGSGAIHHARKLAAVPGPLGITGPSHGTRVAEHAPAALYPSP